MTISRSSDDHRAEHFGPSRQQSSQSGDDMDSELPSITQRIVGCRKCRDDDRTYVGGLSVLATDWAPPRGWAGAGHASVEAVLVALNPGGPLPGEMEHYAARGITAATCHGTPEQAETIHQYCLDQYRAPRRGQNWIFHRKSVALARCLLWLIDGRDPGQSPWSRCWFTDVFKCSTRSESAPQIKDAAFNACRSHLVQELVALKPKLIVALGGAARKRLLLAGIGPFVTFRHPSNGCPRIDAPFHDAAFEAAASLLNVSIPPDFRAIRGQAHDAALAM